jgi:hypothetical protein
MLQRCPVPQAVAELRLISLFDMRTQKPKTRNAWLITWEAVPSYRLEDLGRPRVVAILKPQISDSTLKKVLPILFTSESRLTFTEKIEVGFFAHQPLWLHKDFNGRLSCGTNPHLWARRVKDLYVQSHEDAWDHQTLHWTELARYDVDPGTRRIVEASPEYQCSEDVRFEKLWDEPSRLPDAEV